MHFSNRCGTESICGNRHCPSSAIRAPSICPLLLSATVAVGTSNNGDGRQKSQIKNRTNRTLSFILCLLILFFISVLSNFNEFLLLNRYPHPFISRIIRVVIHSFNLRSRQIIRSQIGSVQFYAKSSGFPCV